MNWKDCLHYGAAVVLFLLGLFAEVGGHLPGVSIDAPTCFTAAIGIFAAGLKGGWKS